MGSTAEETKPVPNPNSATNDADENGQQPAQPTSSTQQASPASNSQVARGEEATRCDWMGCRREFPDSNQLYVRAFVCSGPELASYSSQSTQLTICAFLPNRTTSAMITSEESRRTT